MRSTAAIAMLVCVVACAPPVDLRIQAPATFAREPGGFERAIVARVVDGDTIEVVISRRIEGPGLGLTVVGRSYDVRLLGIDTPESVKPNSPVECFGRESAAAARALLEDRQVRLVKDVEETDDFDRLLRYVYIGDEMANGRLVVNGYAHALTYPPNVRWSGLFVQLQREARESDRGLWSPDTCSGASNDS